MDKAKSTIFGVFSVALALAVVAYASNSVKPSPLTNFRISGDTTTPLYPGGAAAPVDLGFRNPNSFAITVSDVAVKIAGSSSSACDASSFVVGSQFTGTVRVAAGASRSLSQLGIPEADWPRVAMVDSPGDQSACEGSSVELSYTGEATATVSNDSPAGIASGPVYVNGRLFESGGIAYGATVRIEPGGRLELRTRAGTMTVYPPPGQTIRFTIHRVFLKPLYSSRGSEASSAGAGAKPKGQSYTELELIGGGLARCAARPSADGTAQDAGAGAQPAPERSLWAKGTGRLRVRGRFADATARGGWWLTTDRCRGTLVKVKKGTVRVDDVTTPPAAFVEAGGSYRADPRVNLDLKRKR